MASRRLHQYELGDPIGHGGMASVYRGRNLNLDAPVAIKILHSTLASDQSYLARFELEARTAATIQTPNIVKVLDFGSADGTYFIVMELVDGFDMAKVVADLVETTGNSVPMPPEISLLILEEVAYGLRAAHERGIWHRDVKPSNIMLDRQGCVRVADFGLARDSRRGQGPDLTRSGVVLGTPSYMSPEQAAGERLDGRTDVFSLGVMAYQWLSGRRPFPGDSSSEILRRIIAEPPEPLAAAEMPWLTPPILSLINGALNKAREKRTQDMDAFLSELRAGMESLDPEGGVVRHRRDILRRFAEDPAGTAARVRHESAQAHWRRGLLLKDQGLDKLEDALFEFRIVCALEPANREAQQVLRTLERRREDSRPRSTASAESTTVLKSTAAATQEKPGRAHRRRRQLRRLWPVALLLVVVPLILYGRQRASERPPAETTLGQEASLADLPGPGGAAPTDAAAPPSSPAPDPPRPADVGGRAGSGDESATGRESPAGAGDAAAPAPAPRPQAVASGPRDAPRVTWLAPERLVMTVDGAEVWRGKGSGGCDLEPGRVHELVARDDATFASVATTVGPLEAGEIRELGSLELRRGTLMIVGREGMSVRIDGREVAVSSGTVETFAVGAGTHELSVCMPGRQIRDVTIACGGRSAVLGLLNSHDDCAEYKFTIAPDLLHKIAIIFHRAGG